MRFARVIEVDVLLGERLWHVEGWVDERGDVAIGGADVDGVVFDARSFECFCSRLEWERVRQEVEREGFLKGEDS